jgi:bifunctional non-homologous end joining protein LigD
MTWTRWFPLIVDAVARLRCRSIVFDGEAVVCGEGGVSDFDRLRQSWHHESAFLYAFDLIELDGEDLRPAPPASHHRWRPQKELNEHIDAAVGDRFRPVVTKEGTLAYGHKLKSGCAGVIRSNEVFKLGKRLRSRHDPSREQARGGTQCSIQSCYPWCS